MMAIFMPTDFKNLSINNLIKLQYPSQILSNENLLKPYFNIGVVESSSSCMSNVVGSNNLPIMSELSDQNNLKTRLCSEDDSNSNDSELSVGQEKVHNEQSESKNNKHNNNNNNVNSSSNNNNSKESIDSDDDDEEMSNASSSQYTTSSTRLCSPQQNTREIGDMMRPIQFHEEILRSSQLYAEEILRQRIAAAARLQSVTDPKNHSNSLDEPEPSIISKLNFQTGLFSASKLTSADNGSNENGNNIFSAKSAINFQNIHSHLSAISQITNSLGSNNMKKDDTTSLSSLSRESSQSPSGFQQFNKQQHHHHNLHHHHHHNHHQPKHDFHATHQNQLHEHNLKFSIDNILKADFGRRITEPLLKTSRLKRSSKHHQQHQHEKEKINNSFTTVDTLQKEPHNSSVTKDKSIDQTFSSSTETSSKSDAGTSTSPGGTVWPAWVFCTRYSDRPSSGRSPRVKKPKKPPSEVVPKDDEKRPRTAFSGAQLARLKHEFNENRYLTEKRRQQLSGELGLNEAQIKIWFQNKRAKIKKSSGVKNPLALQLMAQGLYNHSTIPLSKEEEELQELQSGN